MCSSLSVSQYSHSLAWPSLTDSDVKRNSELDMATKRNPLIEKFECRNSYAKVANI